MRSEVTPWGGGTCQEMRAPGSSSSFLSSLSSLQLALLLCGPRGGGGGDPSAHATATATAARQESSGELNCILPAGVMVMWGCTAVGTGMKGRRSWWVRHRERARGQEEEQGDWRG